MSFKWSYWKTLIGDLILYQVTPTSCTFMMLTTTRILDSLSDGLSSKVVLGSPIYMWILTTLYAIQLLLAGYTAALKIHYRLIEWKTKTWVKIPKNITEIKQSYATIASTWKQAFSNKLLMDILDKTKAKRVQFYRQIDPRFKVEKDDLDGPVILENGITTSISTKSSGSSIFSRRYKKLKELKYKLGK